jgi:hypothetical protein
MKSAFASQGRARLILTLPLFQREQPAEHPSAVPELLRFEIAA